MKRNHLAGPLSIVMVATLGIGIRTGQTAVLSLNYATASGGGGACSGGKFSLSGIVGQPLAGDFRAGTYTQQGGFVPAFTQSVTPALQSTHSGKTFTFTWPAFCAGFVLEQAPSAGGPWTSQGAGTVAGGNRQVIVMSPPSPAFFRLRKDCGTPLSATDDASQAAYTEGWNVGQNGGRGFGPWALNLSGPGSGGFFAGDSSFNGGNGTSGNINTTGAKSWGMFAAAGKDAEAIRPFSAPLAVGSTITIDMDNGTVSLANENPGGFGPGRVGLSLRSGATVRFELFYAGADLNYSINDSQGAHSSGVPFTDGGLRFVLTVTGTGNTYFAIITRNGSAPITFTGTLQGSGPIDNVRLYDRFAGAISARQLFFNRLQISP